MSQHSCQHKGSTKKCHRPTGRGWSTAANTKCPQPLWAQTWKPAVRAPHFCVLSPHFVPSSCRASPASRPGLAGSGQPSHRHFTFSWHAEKLQRRPSESNILASSSGHTGYRERASSFPKILAGEAVFLQAVCKPSRQVS